MMIGLINGHMWQCRVIHGDDHALRSVTGGCDVPFFLQGYL
jgi:hypothetical protein